jgi:hypothetical protein
MAKSTRKPAAPAKPVERVPLATLTSLLGKPVADPAVAAVVDRSGKVKVSSDYLVAKEAGFDFALDRVPGKKQKVLHTLFLYGEGKRAGFGELPPGFAFTSRRALLANHPAPVVTWKIGPGKVPVDTPDDDVSHDTWLVGGFEIMASYRGGTVAHFCITLPAEATGGASLATHPLHFATRPADAPDDAELVGMALLVGWAADRFGLPEKHATSELGAQLAKRAITPREFLIKACGKTLTTLDVAPRVRELLAIYTRNQHHDDEGARDAIGARIKQLLRLDGAGDERHYTADYLGTFAEVVANPFHVPDSWEAVDRIAPVIDARLADYEATAFRALPDLALYERAAKLRDAQPVTPMRAAPPEREVDDELADQLVALIGKPLADKQVKAVLTRAGLPIGKRIDEQANPALGVSYMGTKFVIADKNQLGIDNVCFYGDGYETYIRGIGSKVGFAAYPGRLPFDLRIGDTREAVRTKVGRELQTRGDSDYFEAESRVTSFEFSDDRLVMLRIAQLRTG